MKIFIDQNAPGFFWLMYQTNFAEHCIWENGKITHRHFAYGKCYGTNALDTLDVAVGALVADY